MTYSHTHAAGLMGLERVALPGGELIAPYLDDLGRRLAGLVTEARQTTNAAVLGYATGRCSLAAHRDYWDAAAGEWVCGFNPEGPTDDTVVTVRITDRAGRIVATMVNYACHPTTLGWQNTKISPDFPGAMREVIETATGALSFLAGSLGRPWTARRVRGRHRRRGSQRPAARVRGAIRPGIAAPAFHPVSVRGGRGFGNNAWPVGPRRSLCRGNGGKQRWARSADRSTCPIVPDRTSRGGPDGLARSQEEHKAAQLRGDEEREHTSRAMIEQMEALSSSHGLAAAGRHLPVRNHRPARWRRLLGRLSRSCISLSSKNCEQPSRTTRSSSSPWPAAVARFICRRARPRQGDLSRDHRRARSRLARATDERVEAELHQLATGAET